MIHRETSCYLMTYQYLGFRYHGWQKQPNLKTVQKMLDKTFSFVLGKEVDIKFITSSRTDAMVSASHTTASLFVNKQLELDGLVEKSILIYLLILGF